MCIWVSPWLSAKPCWIVYSQTNSKKFQWQTLSIPKVRTLYGERTFRYHCAMEWNTLPFDTRSCGTLNSFKAKLNTLFRHIISQIVFYRLQWIMYCSLNVCNQIYWNLLISYKFTQIQLSRLHVLHCFSRFIAWVSWLIYLMFSLLFLFMYIALAMILWFYCEML